MLLSMDEFRAFEPKKTTYALFGWPLGHTMSPELHAQLFEASGQDADYIGVAVPPEDLPEAFELAKRKLPGGLLDILNYSDADACSASIATVEKAWRECVQQGVNERLAQSGVSLKTGTGNQPDPDKMTDDEWFAWRKAQRQQKG